MLTVITYDVCKTLSADCHYSFARWKSLGTIRVYELKPKVINKRDVQTTRLLIYRTTLNVNISSQFDVIILSR